ncbi:MAG: hypothetical protein COA69_13615 [Robiginitomaculum sp.]|nr:MAG: hypothetical protein COA69_13615 [Robiginitomaculum sp.]
MTNDMDEPKYYRGSYLAGRSSAVRACIAAEKGRKVAYVVNSISHAMRALIQASAFVSEHTHIEPEIDFLGLQINYPSRGRVKLVTPNDQERQISWAYDECHDELTVIPKRALSPVKLHY